MGLLDRFEKRRAQKHEAGEDDKSGEDEDA